MSLGGPAGGVGAGGLAQGLSSGLQMVQSIQNQARQAELLKLQQEAQEFREEQATKEQKIRLDAMKLQIEQRKKQAEFQQQFFERLGLSAPGGTQAGSQGSPAPEGAPSGVIPGAGQMLGLAAQAGQLPAFNAAVNAGLIQTPAGQISEAQRAQSVLATQMQALIRQEQLKQLKAQAPFLSAQAGLDLEKTRAEIEKLQAQTRAAERDPAGRLPTRASLALQAANGDPKEALELLKTDRQGLSVEVGEDGSVSVTTGKPSQSIFKDSIKGIQELAAAEQPLRSLLALLQQDPTAASVQGQMRIVAASMQANIDAFSPSGPTGKKIQQRIKNSADASQFEFLGEMAAFSVAAMNNPGGRISDADVASARRALGLPTGLFDRPPSAEIIIPRLNAALELISAKRGTHEDVLRLMEGGQLRKKKSTDIVEPVGIPTPPADAIQPSPATPELSGSVPLQDPSPQPSIPAAPAPTPTAQRSVDFEQTPRASTAVDIRTMPPKDAVKFLETLSQADRAAIIMSLTDEELDRLLKD